MRVEFVWDLLGLPAKSISLPRRVYQHDEHLEENPLADFYISKMPLFVGGDDAHEHIA